MYASTETKIAAITRDQARIFTRGTSGSISRDLGGEIHNGENDGCQHEATQESTHDRAAVIHGDRLWLSLAESRPFAPYLDERSVRSPTGKFAVESAAGTTHRLVNLQP